MWTLYVLQRDNAYDACTLETMKHIQTLYTVGSTVQYLLPTEFKSDFTLLASFCKLATEKNHVVLAEDVSSMRDKAVRFCTQITQKQDNTIQTALRNYGRRTKICAICSLISSFRPLKFVHLGRSSWVGSSQIPRMPQAR